MKIIKILPLFFIFVFASCSKNEMKISRTDKSVVSELIEQSPIYITKNTDGTLSVNEKNRIGNTDWVFSIESSLLVGDVLPHIQKLLKRKYEKGMHPDSKKAYLIYIDTILKQPAYLPIDELEFISETTDLPNVLKFEKNISTEKFIQEMVKITTADTLNKKTPIYIY